MTEGISTVESIAGSIDEVDDYEILIKKCYGSRNSNIKI